MCGGDLLSWGPRTLAAPAGGWGARLGAGGEPAAGGTPRGPPPTASTSSGAGAGCEWKR